MFFKSRESSVSKSKIEGRVAAGGGEFILKT